MKVKQYISNIWDYLKSNQNSICTSAGTQQNNQIVESKLSSAVWDKICCQKRNDL